MTIDLVKTKLLYSEAVKQDLEAWQQESAAKQQAASLKPYLKWAGGKRQLLAEIKKHLPKDIKNRTYFEPFVGAGAVLFDLRPRYAVINDLNSLLITTYNAIKENIDELISLLNEYKNKNTAPWYYEVREADRDTEKFGALSDVQKAARLIYLNKTCYNGLYRVNSGGHFNVPYGNYKNPVICDETLLRHISNYFIRNQITILNGDFADAVETADKASFVYFDPPYHSADKTNFTDYQAGGFDENEQQRLFKLMLSLTKRGVKCLQSNSDTDYIRALYEHERFELIQVHAKRAINSVASGRGAINELLIKNWKN